MDVCNANYEDGDFDSYCALEEGHQGLHLDNGFTWGDFVDP